MLTEVSINDITQSPAKATMFSLEIMSTGAITPSKPSAIYYHSNAYIPPRLFSSEEITKPLPSHELMASMTKFYANMEIITFGPKSFKSLPICLSQPSSTTPPFACMEDFPPLFPS